MPVSGHAPWLMPQELGAFKTCTIVGFVAEVLPLPNWPQLLSPQAHTVPFEVSARLKNPPTAMAVTVPPIPVTGTAVVFGVLLVVPLPSSPNSLSPQAQTVPSEPSARLWEPPAAMAVTAGRLLPIGTALVLLMGGAEGPNCPLPLLPQPQPAPVVPMACGAIARAGGVAGRPGSHRATRSRSAPSRWTVCLMPRTSRINRRWQDIDPACIARASPLVSGDDVSP